MSHGHGLDQSRRRTSNRGFPVEEEEWFEKIVNFGSGRRKAWDELDTGTQRVRNPCPRIVEAGLWRLRVTHGPVLW